MMVFHTKKHPFNNRPIFLKVAKPFPLIIGPDSLKVDKNLAVIGENGFNPSGQIIIFHQPRFPWNKGISRTKPTIWSEVVWGRYNLTRPMTFILSPPGSFRHFG